MRDHCCVFLNILALTSKFDTFLDFVMHIEHSCVTEMFPTQTKLIFLSLWQKNHCQPHHLSSCIYHFLWCWAHWSAASENVNQCQSVWVLDGLEMQHLLLLLFISHQLFLEPLLCLIMTSMNQLQTAQTSAVGFLNKTRFIWFNS